MFAEVLLSTFLLTFREGNSGETSCRANVAGKKGEVDKKIDIRARTFEWRVKWKFGLRPSFPPDSEMYPDQGLRKDTP